MKILHITLSMLGGAGNSCLRLHRALLSEEVDSLVWAEESVAGRTYARVERIPFLPPSKWISRLDRVFMSKRSRLLNRSVWSNGWAPWPLLYFIKKLKPDIVHLHWVGNGALYIRSLPHFPCPVVWTLHDMAPITGGCHHSFECEKYESGCGFCPQLGSLKVDDLSNRNAKLRKYIFSNTLVHFVAPSRWMASKAQASFSSRDVPVTVIHPDLDTDIYKPSDARMAKLDLGIDEDEVVLLMVGQGGFKNPHKGWGVVPSIMSALADANPTVRYRLLMVGAETDSEFACRGVATLNMGFVDDEQTMAKCYAACRLLLFPSEAETFGMVALEAIACGRPVAAYAVGGIPEVVVEGRSGALANERTQSALADAVRRVLSIDEAEWVDSCRQFFNSQYPRGHFVKAHLNIYKNLITAQYEESSAHE